MLKTIAIVAFVFLVALLGFAATRPDSFSLQRSVLIDAPPEKIFALITDFKQWPKWSPWEKLDPNMARTFSGAERGLGVVYAWDSPGKAGAGRMEIKQAAPLSKVVIQLNFIRPFASENTTEFTLQATRTLGLETPLDRIAHVRRHVMKIRLALGILANSLAVVLHAQIVPALLLPSRDDDRFGAGVDTVFHEFRHGLERITLR